MPTLKKMFSDLARRVAGEWLETQPAWLGDFEGTVQAPQSGMVYARLINGKVVEAFNQLAPLRFDVPVKIGRSRTLPTIWQVIEVRELWDTPTADGEIAYHADQHGLGQGDELAIDRKQIVQLTVRMYDPESFIVQVFGGLIRTTDGFALVQSQQVDLSSHVPASGALFVTIEADDSGTLSVHEGTPAASLNLLGVDNVPVPDAGKYTLAIIALYAEIEQLTENGIVVPMPLMADYGGVSVSDHDHAGIYLEEAILPSDGDVSNPPTEAQLIAALGSPDLDAGKKGYVIDDDGTQNNVYLAVAVGGHWWLTPLARAVLASVSVTVDSTDTLATESGQWFGRASIAVLDGIVVLTYKEGSAHQENDGSLHIKFSDDYGATWSAEDTYLDGSAVSGFPMNPTVSAGQDAGEPQLYVAPNGDLLVHMWRVDYGVSLGGSYQSRSTDGGLTWSTPAVIDFGGIADDTKVFSTDDYFVLEGVIYAGARVYSDADGDPSQSILIKSTDNGATWSKVSVIQDTSEGGTGGQEVGLEYLGDDTIIAMLRDNPHTNSYQRVSTDLGATWGTLTDVTSTVGIAGRQRVYTRSHLKGSDEWWKDSVLIMVGFVHQNPPSSQTRRNAVWISQDKGATWSTPFYIDSSTEDAGYGDIFWNPDTEQFVVVNYQGTLAEAVLKKYNLTIGGL